MIYIGADHRGYNLKEKIKTWLKDWGYEFEDLGNLKFDPEDDYPDYALVVAEKVASEPEGWGVLTCGTGAGMDIAANKVIGIRCGLGFSEEQVKTARKNDDINCLALAADFVDEEKVKNLIKIFLKTPFSGEEKHKRRIEKISKHEAA